VIGRYPFRDDYAREAALAAAYLDQPVVWFGHHEDLADGYDILADLAHFLRSLGNPEWMSLEEIGRTNTVRAAPTRPGSEPLDVQRRRSVQIVMGTDDHLQPARRPAPAPLRTSARRVAVEGRDRLRPIVGRLGLEPLARSLESAHRDRRGDDNPAWW
jgi:hypothetical protein